MLLDLGGGLNKSAGDVYWCLLQASMNAKEISQHTGRSRRTVFRVLSRMSFILDTQTGEIISMVEKVGKEWHALDVDLDKIARIVGTYGKGMKQRKKHRDERRNHKRSLALGRKMEENSKKSN